MKRGLKNAITGLVTQILIMVIGIFVPRLFLLRFGSEVNGLVSSISQIFVYFSLLEAGIGAASLQALYAPVATNDKSAISQILSSTRHYYNRTGFFYFVSVIAFAFIYPLTVHSDIPTATVISVILIQGVVGILNYVVFCKYKVLFQAEGKEYVILTLDAFVRIFTNLLRILFIFLGFHIIAVQSAYVILSIVQCLFVYIYVRRHYQWLDLKATPNHKATAQKNNVIIHQVSALVFNNTDILILTFMLGDLKLVSVYVMFSMFFDLINTTVRTISNSINYALGQSFHTDKERFMKLFDCFETYFFVFIFTFYCVTYLFILPFIKLYTSSINDINYIDPYLAVLFLIISLLSSVRIPTNNIINYAGHFKQTQGRSVLEACINIALSLGLVYLCGIYGVLLGTIVALLYRSNDIIIYANCKLLRRSPWNTYKRIIVNLVPMTVVAIYAPMILPQVNNYFDCILWAGIYTIGIGAILFSTSSIFNKSAFHNLTGTVKDLIHKK